MKAIRVNEAHLVDELEEGELYAYRKKHLEQVERSDDDEGMRRVRVTDPAYQAAMEVGRRMRRQMKGYKPDVSLVMSALVIWAAQQDSAAETVRRFVTDLFSAAADAAEPP